MLCYGGVNKHWNYDLDFPITFKFLTNSKNLKESGCNSPLPHIPGTNVPTFNGIWWFQTGKLALRMFIWFLIKLMRKKTNKHLGIPISGYIQT